MNNIILFSQVYNDFVRAKKTAEVAKEESAFDNTLNLLKKTNKKMKSTGCKCSAPGLKNGQLFVCKCGKLKANKSNVYDLDTWQ